MKLTRPGSIRPSEITPEAVYHARRRFITRAAALSAAALGFPAHAHCGAAAAPRLEGDTPNSWDEITGYNNFYEYSPDKRAVAALAQNLRPRPWTVAIEGEVAAPRTVDVDQLLREFHPQQRIYRLRCVEGWSMVIPWDGIPLCEVLSRAQPTSRARSARAGG